MKLRIFILMLVIAILSGGWVYNRITPVKGDAYIRASGIKYWILINKLGFGKEFKNRKFVFNYSSVPVYNGVQTVDENEKVLSASNFTRQGNTLEFKAYFDPNYLAGFSNSSDRKYEVTKTMLIWICQSEHLWDKDINCWNEVTNKLEKHSFNYLWLPFDAGKPGLTWFKVAKVEAACSGTIKCGTLKYHRDGSSYCDTGGSSAENCANLAQCVDGCSSGCTEGGCSDDGVPVPPGSTPGPGPAPPPPPTPTPCFPYRPAVSTEDNINEVKVDWSDRASNERGFSIYRRKAVNNAPYELLTTVAPVPMLSKLGYHDEYTYVDTTAQCGTNYVYRVDAVGTGRGQGACIIRSECRYCPLGTPYPAQCASCLGHSPTLATECKEAGMTTQSACNKFQDVCNKCRTQSYTTNPGRDCEDIAPFGNLIPECRACLVTWKPGDPNPPGCPVPCEEVPGIIDDCKEKASCNEPMCYFEAPDTPVCNRCRSTSGGRCAVFDTWIASAGGGNITAPRGRVDSVVTASNSFVPGARIFMDGLITPTLPVPTGKQINPSDPGVEYTKQNTGAEDNQISLTNTAILYPSAASPWERTITRPENSFGSLSNRIFAKVTNPVVIPAGNTSWSDTDWDNAYAGVNNNNSIRLNSFHPTATNFTPTTVMALVVSHSGDLTLENTPAANPLTQAGHPTILVVNGNVNINSPLTVNDYYGLVFILASGNINISGNLGEADKNVNIADTGYPAHLRGIFYAGGKIIMPSTNPPAGAMDKSLRVDGSLIGMQGVDLRRNYKGAYPALFVQYQPEMIYMLNSLGLRRKVTQEPAVP